MEQLWKYALQKMNKIMNTLVKRNRNKSRNLMTDFFFDAPWMNDFFNEDLPMTQHFTPQSNIVEKDNMYLISMALPGLTKEDVKLDLVDQKLSLSGSYKEEKEDQKDKYISREIVQGSFHREFRLGNQVDESKIEAKFKNGMLEIHLPKSEKASPKSINIK